MQQKWCYNENKKVEHYLYDVYSIYYLPTNTQQLLAVYNSAIMGVKEDMLYLVFNSKHTI